MGSVGFQELVLIFIVALLIFGPKKLPELGKSIGRGLAEFRKASADLRNAWEEEVRLDELKQLEKAANPLEDIDHPPKEEASKPKEELNKPEEIAKPNEDVNKPKTIN